MLHLDSDQEPGEQISLRIPPDPISSQVSGTYLSLSTYILTGRVWMARLVVSTDVWSAMRSHTRIQYWPEGTSVKNK
jgi:hypothetical protein